MNVTFASMLPQHYYQYRSTATFYLTFKLTSNEGGKFCISLEPYLKLISLYA